MVLWILAVAAFASPYRDVWVRVPDRESAEVARTIGLGYVDERDGDWLRMHGSDGMLDALDRAGMDWRPALPPPPATGYPSPDEMDATLEDIAEAWPDLVQLVDVGESLEGRRVLGLRLGTTDTPRMTWRVLGTHHGDELSGAAVTLAIAEDLVDRYASDGEVATLLERDAVWIVPDVNPDGVARHSRYNARSVDLNRNYDYQWSSSSWSSGDDGFSEPETRNVRTLSDWVGFGAGLSLHSGETNLGWVWNYTLSLTPDDALLELLAEAYADECTLPGFWITNGAAWYTTRGDTNDWSYGRHGILDYTLEVSSSKTPDWDTIPGLIDDHLPGVRAFLSWPAVISGEVIDAETGRGIPAKVTLEEDGWPLSTGPQGTFGRPVEEGSWTVEVSAPGYHSISSSLSTDDDEPVTIPLTPADLVELRPDPVLLSRTGDGSFDLGVDADSVFLVRPGYDPVAAAADGDLWWVDLDELAPGPWSIEADGATAPRAIFAGELSDDAEIDTVTVDDDGTLTLTGRGFATGSRAWALWGIDRAPVPVPLLDEANDTLVFDVADLSHEAPADLVIVTGGRQLAVADALGDPTVDTAEPVDTGFIDTGTPSDDTGPVDTDRRAGARDERLSGTSCSSVAGFPGWIALVTLVTGIGARRPPRRRSRPRCCNLPSSP